MRDPDRLLLDPSPRFASAVWLVALSIALVELTGTFLARARTAREADWRAAAAYVRQHFGERDVLTSAPAFTDPTLRWVAGDLLSTEQVGRSDLAGFDRLWALSVDGGHPEEAPRRRPELEQRFGRVRVLRWSLLPDQPPSERVVDLSGQLARARVSLGDPERACLYRNVSMHGGGLGAGPMAPNARFVCDSRRPWLWVGETIVEDLELKPRRCVWQHPAGDEPVRVRLAPERLGERIVFYGGLYYEDEREKRGGEIVARISIDDQPVAEMRHHDGDGWAKLEIDTRDFLGKTASIGVETTAHDPHRRSFCWAASIRRGGEAATGAER